MAHTPEELADALHMAPSTVRQRCQSGEYRAHKDGRKWIIPNAEYLRLTGENAPGHDQGAGDSVLHKRERALQRFADRLEDLLRDVRRELAT